MAKKHKPIKIRRTWNINPKTRVKPNKKKNVTVDTICDACNGTGFIKDFMDAYEVECKDCGGTGLL